MIKAAFFNDLEKQKFNYNVRPLVDIVNCFGKKEVVLGL